MNSGHTSHNTELKHLHIDRNADTTTLSDLNPRVFFNVSVYFVSDTYTCRQALPFIVRPCFTVFKAIAQSCISFHRVPTSSTADSIGVAHTLTLTKCGSHRCTHATKYWNLSARKDILFVRRPFCCIIAPRYDRPWLR